MQTTSFGRFIRKLQQVALHERDLRNPPPPQPTAKVDCTWSGITSEVLEPETGPSTYRKWWVTPTQAARIYLIAATTFFEWMKKGVVSWICLPSGRRVIPVEWIIANLCSSDRRGFAKSIEQRRFRNRKQAIKHIRSRLEIVVPSTDRLMRREERA